MTISNHNTTNVGGLSLFASGLMTAGGGPTFPNGFFAGNFGIMNPTTIEGFIWQQMQSTTASPTLVIQITTVTDLGPDYWKELHFVPPTNDPAWSGIVRNSADAGYFHITGQSVWSFPAGSSPAHFIQGSLYNWEMFR